MRIVRARTKKAGANAWQKVFCIKLTRLVNVPRATGFRVKHGMTAFVGFDFQSPLPRRALQPKWEFSARTI